eukprot:SM000271S10028  [mRNA]  locus=s271:69891:72112:- [translate_table: standard]
MQTAGRQGRRRGGRTTTAGGSRTAGGKRRGRPPRATKKEMEDVEEGKEIKEEGGRGRRRARGVARKEEKGSEEESEEEEEEEEGGEKGGEEGGEEGGRGLAAGQQLVGARIRVWWPLDGRVAAFDAARNRHRVEYDDGDQEDLRLGSQRWEEETDEGSAPPPGATARDAFAFSAADGDENGGSSGGQGRDGESQQSLEAGRGALEEGGEEGRGGVQQMGPEAAAAAARGKEGGEEGGPRGRQSAKARRAAVGPEEGGEVRGRSGGAVQAERREEAVAVSSMEGRGRGSSQGRGRGRGRGGSRGRGGKRSRSAKPAAAAAAEAEPVKSPFDYAEEDVGGSATGSGDGSAGSDGSDWTLGLSEPLAAPVAAAAQEEGGRQRAVKAGLTAPAAKDKQLLWKLGATAASSGGSGRLEDRTNVGRPAAANAGKGGGPGGKLEAVWSSSSRATSMAGAMAAAAGGENVQPGSVEDLAAIVTPTALPELADDEPLETMRLRRRRVR